MGVSRGIISERMDRVNYEIARQHLLDETEIKFLNRRRLRAFDPNLALAIYRGQIDGLVDTIDAEVARQDDAGITLEIEMFNDSAISHTLSTTGEPGHPEVAIFTGVASFVTDGAHIEMGLIGNQRVYANLKANPKAVFTSIGPSMDPKRWAGVRVHATLSGDDTHGDEYDALKVKLGMPIANRLLFDVEEIETVFIPKAL